MQKYYKMDFVTKQQKRVMKMRLWSLPEQKTHPVDTDPNFSRNYEFLCCNYKTVSHRFFFFFCEFSALPFQETATFILDVFFF